MHSTIAILLQIVNAGCVLGLTLYGLQALWLLWIYVRYPSGCAPQTSSSLLTDQGAISIDSLPAVTVQIPIFNERHVAERVIDACAALDYPAHKLTIQILDDSTDITTSLVWARILFWRSHGINMELLHRTDRSGYKAGALANALQNANGELLAIFDADFVPAPDFLLAMVPYFLQPNSERLGFVQARWGHLNAGYSILTQCQALALDGHFAIEQEARRLAGYAFGFNGSAGIWRKACIEDPRVGGWSHDTLCEDLDLSYRAMLAGWGGHYANEVEARAEIPPQLLAFKRQQFRWAKGSIQALCKLYKMVTSSNWSVDKRVAALVHLGSYLLHPCLIGLLVLALPLTLLGVSPAKPLALLSLASLGPPTLYALAQHRLHGSKWYVRWRTIPILTLLGTGLSLNNTVAVWQGLTASGGQFLRTPKFRIESTHDAWQSSIYRLPLNRITLAEIFLALYACLTIVVSIAHQRWMSVPFLLLYAGGYGMVLFIDAWQQSDRYTHPRKTTRSIPARPRPSLQSTQQREPGQGLIGDFVKPFPHRYNDRRIRNT